MGQLVAGGWTQEQSDALENHVKAGMSYAQAAAAINAAFGTSFTRNSAIGRANRIGLSGIPRERKPRAPRAPKQHKPRLRLMATNHGGLRVMMTSESTLEELRCVEVVPRNVSLLDLKSGECRYPSEDAPFTFCGHPIKPGSSYCVPHHHLCWQAPRVPIDRFVARRAA